MINSALGNLNGMIDSVNDLTRTLREVSTADDIRKIRELEEKGLANSGKQEEMLALLDQIYDEMSDEDKARFLDLMMKAKKKQAKQTAVVQDSNRTTRQLDPEEEEKWKKTFYVVLVIGAATLIMALVVFSQIH